ncbi:hypothetical protein [Sphaerisporangium fuscum]|uniref:hypothetical protein n=1 Tax=Sphaerisporangium fuscum TaxID=2835868 RepID=UPI001BDCA3FA|nr:hypothetical protein [Sphaerisporangium fuscum]
MDPSPDRPRIIQTVGDLAAAFPAATPLRIEVEEIEPGHDPNLYGWAVVAGVVNLPLNDTGDIAGPGEQIATTEPDDHGNRRPRFTPVVALQSRKLAVPGQIGPVAHAADPCQRRMDAYHDAADDGDMTRYLMELLSAVEELRDEVAEAARDEHRRFHPGARRHLAALATALETARRDADEATRYGTVCELIRTKPDDPYAESLGLQTPCDHEHLYDMRVELPGQGHDELACPVHAAIAERTIPGAIVRPDPM